MKLKTLQMLLPAALLTYSALGDLVNINNNGEQSLYQALGYLNNAALNNPVGGVYNQSGGAYTDFTLNTTVISSQYSSLLLELAGNAPNNTFGIYDTAATGNKLQILDGSAGPNLDPSVAKQLTFTVDMFGVTTISVAGGGSLVLPSGHSTIGFYLNTGAGGNGTFYSQMGLNGGNLQHVAAFNILDTAYGRAPFPTVGQSGYVMGWEDLPAASSDLDYQDMVVSLTALPVPEPTTIVAGVLLLVPFGASTFRTLRRKNVVA
jgi:hypothetical protein